MDMKDFENRYDLYVESFDIECVLCFVFLRERRARALLYLKVGRLGKIFHEMCCNGREVLDQGCEGVDV